MAAATGVEKALKCGTTGGVTSGTGRTSGATGVCGLTGMGTTLAGTGGDLISGSLGGKGFSAFGSSSMDMTKGITCSNSCGGCITTHTKTAPTRPNSISNAEPSEVQRPFAGVLLEVGTHTGKLFKVTLNAAPVWPPSQSEWRHPNEPRPPPSSNAA